MTELSSGGLACVTGDTFGTGHLFDKGEPVRLLSKSIADDGRIEWNCLASVRNGEAVVHEIDLEPIDMHKLTVVDDPSLPLGVIVMGNPIRMGNPAAVLHRPVSETGGAKDQKLADYAAIPHYPLQLLAERYGLGAQKYGPAPNGLDNWRAGYSWSLSYSALQRHLAAFWGGDDIDEETGQPHLVAAAWHCFALTEWGRHPELVAKFDDRQDPRTGVLA